jgi:transposase
MRLYHKAGHQGGPQTVKKEITMITEPPPIVGVDIAKDKFDVCLVLPGKRLCAVFPNTASGVARLVAWLAKAGAEPAATHVCMEATGVYSRSPCARLHAHGFTVHLENPARIAAHAKALGKRSKTDAEDAFVIADYCRANLAQLRAWEPPAKNIALLRELLRRREQLTGLLTAQRNMREACADTVVVASCKRVERVLLTELKATLKRIAELLASDETLAAHRDHLTAMKGVGVLTAAELICHVLTHEYEDARACAVHTGLTPAHRESGKSIHGSPRISRRGDAHIRHALYMPAVAMARYNAAARVWIGAILLRGKAKKAALCALMRKLVQVAYGVITTNTTYDPTKAFPSVAGRLT